MKIDLNMLRMDVKKEKKRCEGSNEVKQKRREKDDSSVTV